MATSFSSTSSSRVGTRPFSGSRPRAVVVRAPVTRTTRQALVVKAGLFDFLAPKPSAPAVDPRAQELSEALIDICSQTQAGSKASPTTKAEIEQLVSELSQYCIKSPLKSPLLWGTYDVLYCSKPTAVGGPLKKGPGPVLAPGQQARQILEEPNTLINEVTFKTLGFLPGYSRQFGTIQPISGDTFVLRITEGELNPGTGAQKKAFDITRKIQVLFLDDTLRIARFLPSDDLTDEEAESAEGGPESDEILFVFGRVAEQAEEEEEELVVEEEEEEERAPSPVLSLFGGTRKVESIATQVERQVESQRTRRGGTQAFFIGGRQQAEEEEEEEEQEDPRAARARERAEAQARKQREQDEKRAAADRARQEAAAAKAAEQARAQKEKEAAAKAKAAQEARERAEQEKAERAARAQAIREQLAELAEELKEKQAAAREATKAAREVARENQAVLKQVAAAEAGIKEAEADVQQVATALDEAAAARKAAEQQLKQAQQAVKEAESAYKQKVAAR